MSLNGGRYRFATAFVEYLLRNGLESPHKLFNEYIEKLTTCLPGVTEEPFSLVEPQLNIELHMVNFEWDRLRAGRFFLQLLIPPLEIW